MALAPATTLRTPSANNAWASTVAVLVPNLYMVRDATAQALEQYVAGGGTLAMSFFSGIADENEHIRLGGYPAPFRRLLEDFVGRAIEADVPHQRRRDRVDQG